ncbi:MAG: extracellular solute-binding protein [Prevotella sp.]|nr:extracellular solute-binding protein [Prevotella sp.]
MPNLKKVFAALFSAAFCLTFSACGKTEPPLTEEGKKIISVYTLYIDDGLTKDINDFNKKSAEYHAEVTVYGEDFPDNPLTHLNNDIIAGKVPDVVILHPLMPVDSYISKGFLADLYGFMESDETVSRSDFLESVLKAYEINGCLYEIVPSFKLNTLAGKASLTGNSSGWTAEEFIGFADENPGKNIIGGEYTVSITAEEFFSSVTNLCRENFIDRKTGKCSFNSEAFAELMEFSGSFPSEVDLEQMEANSNNYWSDFYESYRDGGTLLKACSIGNFDDIRVMEKSVFTTPVALKGYPEVKGNGAVLNSHFELAVSTKAANSEGAWEFLKFFLSEEYQEQYAKTDSEYFPVKVSAVEKAAEASKELPFYEDENGRKIYEQKTVWNGITAVNVGVNSDGDIQRVLDFINGAESISRKDNGINSIIEEEAATYFSGQKSAEEVAGIIQNRVNNYIKENR